MDSSAQLKDITDIPYFAYAPGILAWSVFIAASVLFIFLLRRWLESRRTSSALQIALGELEQLCSRQSGPYLSKEQAALASLVTKRFLAVDGRMRLAHLSTAELRALGDGAGSLELRRVLDDVLALDQARYRPDGDRIIDSGILARLRDSLRAYQESLEREARKANTGKESATA